MRNEFLEVGAVSASGGSSSRRRIVIISAGWGSSGYYSREVLARDGPRVFREGTLMYLDHPSRTEEMDRPERSVKDLAAKISTVPHMEGNDLVAEAEIFPVWRETIDALAETIGLSIRAYGESEWGEAEGRQGTIVLRLDEAASVDFVTEAGRGGRVMELIESARTRSGRGLQEARNAGHWFEAMIHRQFTAEADRLFGDGHLTREERIALSAAIGDGLTAFNASVEANAPGLYRRDPFAELEPIGVELDEGVKENTVRTDAERITALEAQVTDLTERLTAATETAVKEAARADRGEDALTRVGAERVVREAVEAIEGLPDRAYDRAVQAAMRDRLPLIEGTAKVDLERLRERARKAAEDERDYLLESTGGNGKVTGLGGSTFTESADRDTQARLVESFKGLGMSEDAAKIAAGGR